MNPIRKMAERVAKTAAFMEPQIEYGTWISIDGPMGGEENVADYVDLEEIKGLQKEIEENGEVSLEGTSLHDFFDNNIAFEIDVIQGYGARLSAPGYMDATEWAVFDTEQEAKEYLMETYDLDENLEEIEENW